MRGPGILLSAVFLFVSLCSFGFAVEKKDEKKLKMGDRDDALMLRINNAITKGRGWLLTKQNPDGSFIGGWGKFKDPNFRFPMGETALSLLALLKSGCKRGDEPITKGFKWLRRQPLRKVYEVSVLIMALEALYADKRPPPIDPKAITRVARQKLNVPKKDLDWMQECVRFLLDNRACSQKLLGEDTGGASAYKDVWHYPAANGDHSNTQFALLGLKSASKCGIRIPDDVWVLTLRHFLEVQERGGPEVRRFRLIEDRKHGYVSYKPVTAVPDHARGWAYSAAFYPKGKCSDKSTCVTGSMTCVGISNLSIALSELGAKTPPALKKRGETGIKDGLAWLCHNWKIDCNPHHPLEFWHFYYLYGLERVGVLTWRRAIGKHDWYREGAEYLCAKQGGDGMWDDNRCPGPINNSCFALLFLTRATVPGRMVITGR
jgi:hypothetical protein